MTALPPLSDPVVHCPHRAFTYYPRIALATCRRNSSGNSPLRRRLNWPWGLPPGAETDRYIARHESLVDGQPPPMERLVPEQLSIDRPADPWRARPSPAGEPSLPTCTPRPALNGLDAMTGTGRGNQISRRSRNRVKYLGCLLEHTSWTDSRPGPCEPDQFAARYAEREQMNVVVPSGAVDCRAGTISCTAPVESRKYGR
jgi:hypothetical protein